MKRMFISLLAVLGILYCGLNIGEAKRAEPQRSPDAPVGAEPKEVDPVRSVSANPDQKNKISHNTSNGVEPVVHKGVKYIAPQDKMGYVQAWSVEDEEMLWEKKVYDVKIDPKLEEDVQQIRITSLSVKDDKLIVANEAKEKYEIDLKNEKAPVKSIKEESPLDMLKKAGETYYDIEEQGATRYACFVKVPDIAKVQQFRTKFIMEKVDYELIWEKTKPIHIKPRDIPGYFGGDARFEAEVYAKLMEAAYQEFLKATSVVKNIINLIDNLEDDSYEVSSSKEADLTRIELALKNKAEPPRRRRERNEGKDEGEKDNANSDSDTINIWLNREYQITKFEMTQNEDRLSVSILPVKYRSTKLWNISKLDIVKKSRKDEFVERTVITYVYEYSKNIMIPSLITLNVVDKSGKLVNRRNEVNPINIQFTKYEVEVNK